MLYSSRNMILVTTILVTLLSFTKNTDAGIPILDKVTAIWGLFETNDGIGQDLKMEIMYRLTLVFYDFKEKNDSIESLGPLVRRSSELKPLFNDIYNYIYGINIWLEEAQEMLKYFNNYENEDLLKFAEDMVLGGETVTICLEKLLDMVTHSRLRRQNVIQMLMEYNEGTVCETEITTSQLLNTFYHQLLTTEAKGLATTQFSFMILRKLKQKKFTGAINKAKKRADKRVKELTTTFESLIKIADKTIIDCDPAIDK